MKCDSHYAIANQIYKNLINPIYPKYQEDLRNGSVHPHTEGVSIPHYKGRENDIELFIRKARKFMINKKPKDTIFYIGIALHYIQDKCTAVDDSKKKHEQYKTLIAKSKILPLRTDLSRFYPILSEGVFEEYDNLLTCINQTPLEAEKIIQIIRQWKPSESSAFLDLNIAYRLSYKVSEIVLQPIKNPSFENSVKVLFSEYKDKILGRDKIEKEKLDTKLEEYTRLQEETGILVFIPRFFAKLLLDRAANSYKNQEHLQELFKQYQNEFIEISLPYRDWYLIGEPPEISISEELPEEIMNISVAQVAV
jgi:hypothetical protein